MAGSSEQCPHGMGSPEWCSLCKNAEKPSVYITGGGMAYHTIPNCNALAEGQALVANPEPVVTVALGSQQLKAGGPVGLATLRSQLGENPDA